MILSEVVIVERESYAKIDRTHCLQIWIMVDGLGPQFFLASSFNRWYLVLQLSRISSVFFESELGGKSNF